MRIGDNDSAKRYFELARATGSAINVHDIVTEETDEQKEMKLRLKEWAESPAGKMTLSHDAQKLLKGTADTKAQVGEEIDISNYHPFTDIADEFRNTLNEAGMTIGLYEYSDGLDAAHINTDVIDRMEQQYRDLKKEIEESCTGDELESRLKKLDEDFDSAFEQKIIDPIVNRLSQRLEMFRPDEDGDIKNAAKGSASRQGFEEYMSHYISAQRVKRSAYPGMEESAEKFLDFARDKSSWHDTDRVKNALLDTAKSQESAIYKSTNDEKGSRLARDKEWADAIAKKIADKYNRQQSLDKDLSEEPDDTNILASLGKSFVKTSGDMIYLDRKSVV